MKRIIFTCSMLAVAAGAGAQVKVGNNPNAIDSSAVLDIEHPNKGVLLPRVSLGNTTTWGLAGPTPVAGMTLYNSNAAISSTNAAYPVLPGGTGQYYWDGTGWVGMKFTSNWSTTGNAGTNSSVNFLGTTDNHSLKLKVNNQLAGFIDSAGGTLTYGLSAGSSSYTAPYRTYNTFLGYQSGLSNTVTANTFQGRNTGVGYNTLQYTSTGFENTAVGYIAMQGNTAGLHNTAIGSQALANSGFFVVGNAGEGNTAVGWKTLYNNTGNYNVGIGFWALGANNTTASIVSGDNNIAIGNQAMYKSTSGANNIAIGYHAGYSATTGNNNVLIGYNAGTAFTTESNRLIIANTSSTLVDGDFSTGVVTLNSVLKLNPLADAPASPAKGMIYFNSSTNKAYCYDGTTWQALW